MMNHEELGMMQVVEVYDDADPTSQTISSAICPPLNKDR
jgi:hypothetical protein